VKTCADATVIAARFRRVTISDTTMGRRKGFGPTPAKYRDRERICTLLNKSLAFKFESQAVQNDGAIEQSGGAVKCITICVPPSNTKVIRQKPTSNRAGEMSAALRDPAWWQVKTRTCPMYGHMA
jgi:hypothetical protein